MKHEALVLSHMPSNDRKPGGFDGFAGGDTTWLNGLCNDDNYQNRNDTKAAPGYYENHNMFYDPKGKCRNISITHTMRYLKSYAAAHNQDDDPNSQGYVLIISASEPCI